MGRYYGTKIHAGTMTIEQVPALWVAVTNKWLAKNPTK